MSDIDEILNADPVLIYPGTDGRHDAPATLHRRRRQMHESGDDELAGARVLIGDYSSEGEPDMWVEVGGSLSGKGGDDEVLADKIFDLLVLLTRDPRAALEEILAERRCQDEKWGGRDHDAAHSPDDWRRLIVEHVAKGNTVQVGALAFAALEALGRRVEDVALMVDDHYVDISEDGWSMQHPLRCRPDLLSCADHLRMSKFMAPTSAPPVDPGRYRLDWTVNGTPEFLPLEEAS